MLLEDLINSSLPLLALRGVAATIAPARRCSIAARTDTIGQRPLQMQLNLITLTLLSMILLLAVLFMK